MKVISVPKDNNEYNSYKNDGFDDESLTKIFQSQIDGLVDEFKLMARFRGTTNIVSYEDHVIVPKKNGFGWNVLIRMELLTALPNYYAKNPMDEADTIKLGVDMCRALELCESFNIVHRDIKPANIFVNDFGDFKLGDFGVARAMEHTTRATKVGTYSYMAPEVYRGDKYNCTADIYSLGMVLYWLLNERRLPFVPLPPEVPSMAQSNEAQARRMNGEALPPPKNGSEELKKIVLKACAPNVLERFKDAAEMGAALQGAVAHIKKAAAVPVSATGALIDDAEEDALADIPANDGKTIAVRRAPNNDYDGNSAVQPKSEKADNRALAVSPVPNSAEEDALADIPANDGKTIAVRRAPEESGEKTIAVRRAPGGYAEDNAPAEKEKKSRNVLKGILVALCALLIIGIGAIVVYFAIGKDSTPNTDESSAGLVIAGDDNTTFYYSEDDESYEESANESFESYDESIAESSEEASGEISVEISNETSDEASNEVTSVAVAGAPAKTSYYVGEVFDYSGLTLKVTYADGSTQTVSDGFEYDAVVFTEKGEQTVSVTYGGKEAKINVTVAEATLVGISVIGYPNTYYISGQSLDTSGLALNAKYSDGTEETVTSGFTCTPTSFSGSGTKTVTVSYGGKTTSFTVEVSDVAVTSVAVKSKPNKTNYYVGDTLNTTGLTLTVKYNDNTSKTVTSGFSCTPTVLNKTGTVTVTVSYGGKSTTFTVSVSAVQLTSITVKSKPTKTSYYVGDTLNTAGLTLAASYNNGTTKTVTSGFGCTPTSLNSAGTQTITVSYGGKSTTFTVSVSAVSLTSITVKSKPTKTSYYVGDTLNTAGLTLAASYNNGTTKTVTSGFGCTPTSLSSAGTQTITVSYGGKSTTFTVSVSASSDSLKNAKVGDYITFGAYEQDNNTSNGKEDIEWLVLDIQDGKALVISKYGLDCQPYNTEDENVTWETCTLRTWLNEDFLYSAFSASEIARIPTVTVSADANPYYDTDPGNDTNDKVFLLSITEANKYFSFDSKRECKATAYAIEQGAWTSSDSSYYGNCWWWLRSPGDYQTYAASVDGGGYVSNYGSHVDYSTHAVRPALWINLDS